MIGQVVFHYKILEKINSKVLIHKNYNSLILYSATTGGYVTIKSPLGRGDLVAIIFVSGR